MSSNPSWSIPITPLGSVAAATRAWTLDGRICASILVKATFAAGADGGVMTLAGPEPIAAADAQDPPRVLRSSGDARAEEQRVDVLRGDETIELHGAAPGAPRIRCRLPGVRASALFHGLGPGAPRQIDLRPEILRIDEARRRCSLTFRASITLPGDARPGDLRVVAALGLHGAPPMLPGLEDDDDADDLDDATAVRADRGPSARAVDATVVVQPVEPAREVGRAALPFVEAPPGSIALAHASGAPPPRRAADADADSTLALDPEAADRVVARGALPFGHASTPVPAPPPSAPAREPAPAPRPAQAAPAGQDEPAPEKRSASWATVAEEEKADVAHRAEAARRLPQKPNLKADLYGDFIRRGKR